MNKKLMIVTASLGSGGLERIVSNVASSYINKEYDVYIVTIMNPTGEVFVKLNPKVEVINFNGLQSMPSRLDKFFLSFKWIRFLKKIIKTINPDYILAMTLKIGALVCVSNVTKSRLTIREISDPKSKVRSNFFNSICFWLTRKANAFIFQTNWEQKCYPVKLQKKGYVIPNPVMLPTISSGMTRKSIITMGRLYNIQKKHDILIKSFALFSQKFPEYTLEIYGDGPDLDFDKQLCKQLNIDDKVFFMGACKNVHNLISGAAFFVLSSDFEGMSNALLEAMLMGIPCISTNWPGVEDVIKHGVNGLIVERDNVQQISQSMSYLASDENIRLSISKSALEERPKFDMKIIMEEYSKAIEGK